MANGIISYSVTSETNAITTGLLPHYSSVFSSELIAIHEAVKIALKIPGKHAICSDSLSLFALRSLSNSNNHSYYPSNIGNFVSNHFPKIILIWIPSHIGITGNENADKAAKEAHKYPLTSSTNNSNDISHFFKKHIQSKQTEMYNNVARWYKRMLQTSPQSICQIPPNTNRKTQILLHRLRLGHTKLTNAHYTDRALPNSSPFCHHSTIDIQHIIIHCPSLSQPRSESFHSLNAIK